MHIFFRFALLLCSIWIFTTLHSQGQNLSIDNTSKNNIDYENNVKKLFKNINDQFESDILDLNIDYKEINNKKILSELKLIREHPTSKYAFNKMYTFLIPSLKEFHTEIMETYECLKQHEPNNNNLFELKHEIDRFYSNNLKQDQEEFIDIGDSILISDNPATLNTEFYLIDIWATWCGPCIKGHTELNKISLDPSLKNKISVISLAIMSDMDSWNNYNINNKFSFYMYWVDWEKYNNRFEHLNISSVPLYLIVRAKDNKIMERSITIETIEKQIKKYL
ncbi:TlpA family protein disulfide reductase [Sphingobacterium sp. HJSM2_6]|uniref:TlpA family protein disulfide reductase n=1 Tax=Sphingobacterium sp. HJSM2_6 TaxID=3366264 RepID=UPI003BC81D75